ncbi:NineTeen Complex (NTC) component [Komagataella phaffii CBS 7435]|uniref:Pre-mRNA-splicing factor SYF1 n=2 Tax=Komagataella phaffii TaxID=460519 RepID=C4QWD9_KOMPG|nr:Component of the spliceosome complex involved in pre-mRNA splicing [Komagataella phaffii GS115]AOA61730.1 GQ67_02775T0 [Komagataella phaffii]CAH2446232.1 NineTeen Complex (NTC) component [Komagataella phaffii CBS 7435]AOA65481.1 GQ68_02473T0 [Komagataella phaffii GS115]CAY67562.1 Component of the spliceosome complex involved in pre-mRNA splicing [Komagataella phaffii GS115]CCA36658.1 NineTeen Complex (NTC) component [Komagataella phaffii CBS 7435]
MEKLITYEDLAYEESLLLDPYSLESWIAYYRHKEHSSPVDQQFYVLFRAANALKRAPEIWILCLKTCVKLWEERKSELEEFDGLIKVFEQSLLYNGSSPIIWALYLKALVKYSCIPGITFVRRKSDQCLQTLPFAKHHLIWPFLLQFADDVGAITSLSIWTRFYYYKKTCMPYVRLQDASSIEEETGFIPDQYKLENVTYQTILHKLTSQAHSDLSAYTRTFQDLLDNTEFLATVELSELKLYTDYLNVLIKHPQESENIDYKSHDTKIEKLVQYLIEKFPDQQASMIIHWTQYWINRGNFHKVREIFEVGITKSKTVKDFVVVYDTYLEFEETVISTTLKDLELQGLETSPMLELRMHSFEQLMDRRELLMNDVLLRQDKNDVATWLDRVAIFDKETQLQNVLATYVEAIRTIDPGTIEEPGVLPKLWLGYIDVYKSKGDLKTARKIYAATLKANFPFPEDLADLVISWAEMELENDDYPQAIDVMKTSLKEFALKKSTKLWSFYLDLVESSGNIPDTIKLYDTVIDLKIATPLTILNYCNFLEEHQRYQECLRCYEKGVHLFRFPVSFEIWNVYLSKMVNEQAKFKLTNEHIRDLFEQCIEQCPLNLVEPIYIGYAKFELDHGFISKAFRIYEQAIEKLEDEKEKYNIFKIYIQVSLLNQEDQKTRKIYEQALESLPATLYGFTESIVIPFVELEIKLKEISRARAIFHYAADLIVPTKKNPILWERWERFELHYGNEDTFKSMLRYQRSIDDQAKLEDVETLVESNAPVQFVASSTGPQVGSATTNNMEKKINPDAIDLEFDDLSD